MLWKPLPLTIRIPELYNWQSPNSTRMMASNPRYLVFQPPTHTKLLFSLGQHARCSLALVAVDGRPGGTLPGRQVAPLPRSSSAFCLLLRHRHGPCHRLWSCNCGRILHKNLLINRNPTPRSSVHNHSPILQRLKRQRIATQFCTTSFITLACGLRACNFQLPEYEA